MTTDIMIMVTDIMSVTTDIMFMTTDIMIMTTDIMIMMSKYRDRGRWKDGVLLILVAEQTKKSLSGLLHSNKTY